jgi:hypothetical protein
MRQGTLHKQTFLFQLHQAIPPEESLSCATQFWPRVIGAFPRWLPWFRGEMAAVFEKFPAQWFVPQRFDEQSQYSTTDISLEQLDRVSATQG